PWLVKLDSLGNKSWEYNGTDLGTPAKFISSFSSVLLTDDGYMAAGTGTLTGTGQQDFYLVKFNSNGTIAWRKAYGGSRLDLLYSMTRTHDGKYILVGSTMSVDGNVSGNHGAAGTEDIWMICVDASGNLLWQKCFGGSAQDVGYSVAETPDHGFLIAGASWSVNGDLQSNKGAADAWLIRTNASGQLLWQKNLGGTGNESFRDIALNSDNTFTVVGTTDSPVAEGHTCKGGRDAWLVRVSDAGTLLWSKGYGGSGHEEAGSIQRIWGNEYLISGCTKSTNGDVSSITGPSDAWMFRVAANGNFVWGKTAGGIGEDAATQAIALSETDYVLFGYGRPSTVWTGDSGNGLFVRFGNRNTIKGTVYFDANSNGMKDPSEKFFSDGVVRMNSDRSALPRNGAFEFVAGLGSYTTTFVPYRSYFNVVPASASSNFSTYFNTDSLSFAVQPIPGRKDLVVQLIPLGPARLAGQADYRILYRNAGTEFIPSGEILMRRDPKLELDWAIPDYTMVNGSTLRWTFTNLAPLDTGSIFVTFRIAPLPFAPLGTVLTSSAIINPVAGDETPWDDTSWVRQTIVSASTPGQNYMGDNTAGSLPASSAASSFIQYTVTFQNTGTGTVSNLVIRDTLDAKLDWSSLQMVGSSHPCEMTVENGRVSWTFNGINLPNMGTAPGPSAGFIAFQAKPKNTVVVNDIIYNTASIYYDMDLPVRTNTISTVIVNNLTVLPEVLVEFSGRMNGRKADLNWKTEDAASLDKFEVQRSLDGRDYATIGTVNSTGSGSSYSFSDDLSQLSAPVAYYRLKMVELDGKTSFSQVLVFREQGVGSQLLVYPNPVKGKAFVSFMSPAKARIELQLVDASGRLVLRRSCDVEKGNNILSLSGLERFLPGTYTLQLINGAERLNSRVVLQ
ncbi:MAG TPA: T9SS type A sorting domain-containing protein, partial [Flavisolibacter sp.]